MRRYLAMLDFDAGEVGVPFFQGVEARDYKSATKKVQRYMHTYYEGQRPDVETERNWEWHDIGVGIKLSATREVKDYDSL